MRLAQSVIALTPYWRARCSFRESLSWLTRTMADPKTDRTLRYRLLTEASWIESVLGQTAIALEHADEALALAVTTRDQRAEAMALNYLAMVTAFCGNLHSGLECYERARSLVRRPVEQQSSTASSADERLLALISGNLGTAQLCIGDVEEARANLNAALGFARSTADAWFEALTLTSQSALALQDSDVERAEYLAGDALQLAIAMDNRFLMLRAIGQVAAVSAAKRLPQDALRLAAAVEFVAREVSALGFEKAPFSWWYGGPDGVSRLQLVRDLLPPAKAEETWAEGSRMNLYEAAACAAAGLAEQK